MFHGYPKTYLDSLVFENRKKELDRDFYNQKISGLEYRQRVASLFSDIQKEKLAKAFKPPKNLTKIQKIRKDDDQLLHEHRSMKARQAMSSRRRNTKTGRFVSRNAPAGASQRAPSGSQHRSQPSADEPITVAQVEQADFQRLTQPSGGANTDRSLVVQTEYNLPDLGPATEWEVMIDDLHNLGPAKLIQKYIAKVAELTHCKREYKKLEQEYGDLVEELDKCKIMCNALKRSAGIDQDSLTRDGYDIFEAYRD